jgi:cysteine sulfinate desulfinase/cysteine desulfurase-like protein
MRNDREAITWRWVSGSCAEAGEAGFSEASCFAVRLALEEAARQRVSPRPQGPSTRRCAGGGRRTTIGPLSRIEISIVDAGPGIRPGEAVPDPTAPENITKTSGRGLLLIRSYMTVRSGTTQGRKPDRDAVREARGLISDQLVGFCGVESHLDPLPGRTLNLNGSKQQTTPEVDIRRRWALDEDFDEPELSRCIMDNAATTRTDPRVVEAMLPAFTETYGNPGSRNHAFGWRSEDLVDTARRQVADLIGADRKEVIFTSGATESNNLAIKGAAYMYEKAPAGSGKPRGHIITGNIEHKATLDPCKRLQKEGFEVTYLEPGPTACSPSEMVENAMRDDTILVSIMWANNEIGVINEIPRDRRALPRPGRDLPHRRDAVGRQDADRRLADNVDLLSLSGSQDVRAQGCGRLYVRRRRPRVRLVAIQEGGGQERGYRSGTLNVPGIVGLGKACELCGQEMEGERERLRSLRDRLETTHHEPAGHRAGQRPPRPKRCRT